MADLTQEDWRAKLAEDDNAVILDVRTEEEIEEGAIPGAKHIDIYMGQGFLDEVDKLDREKHYYIYCRSGNRSGQACALMNARGFKVTYNLMGGFNEWEGEVT